MAETPDSGAAAAPAPTAAVNTPRGQRQQRRQRRSRGVVLALAAVGAVLFTSVTVWLGSSNAPYVTHREVMAIAVAIEGAQSVDEVRRMVRFDAPAGTWPVSPFPSESAPTDLASWIWLFKSKTSYAYLGARDEQTERPRLLFRATLPTKLIDYQELRVARDASGIRVVDLYSMFHDRWFSELLHERERLADALHGPQVAALTAAVTSRDAPAAIAMYRALPDTVRASVIFGVELLSAFPIDERVFTELREQHRDWLALGFHALVCAQVDDFANKPAWLLDAALQVLPRIKARTDDDEWTISLTKALKTAGAK
jgi:hypothetical protein